jgi:hypothetical protein
MNNEVDDKTVNKLVNELTDSINKYNVSFFSFLRNISTLSVGLIGLLIGLKPAVIPNQYAKVFFLLSIFLIGLCILSSLVAQHYEINYLTQANKIRLRNIESYIQNPSENILQKSEISKGRIYKVSEIVTYSCLTLSIITLICYVYFLEFYC